MCYDCAGVYSWRPRAARQSIGAEATLRPARRRNQKKEVGDSLCAVRPAIAGGGGDDLADGRQKKRHDHRLVGDDDKAPRDDDTDDNDQLEEKTQTTKDAPSSR